MDFQAGGQGVCGQAQQHRWMLLHRQPETEVQRDTCNSNTREHLSTNNSYAAGEGAVRLTCLVAAPRCPACSSADTKRMDDRCAWSRGGCRGGCCPHSHCSAGAPQREPAGNWQTQWSSGSPTTAQGTRSGGRAGPRRHSGRRGQQRGGGGGAAGCTRQGENQYMGGTAPLCDWRTARTKLRAMRTWIAARHWR